MLLTKKWICHHSASQLYIVESRNLLSQLSMEQHSFGNSNIRLWGSSSEKVTRNFFFMTKIMPIKMFYIVWTLWSVQKYLFCSMKTKFLLHTDISGIINCSTFSVAPSIINQNAKKRVVPFYLLKLTLLGL